MDARVVKYD